MALVAWNGENRRSKTAVFLLCCFLVGVFPHSHWVDPSKSLVPAIVLSFLLGGYGLRIVLKDRQKLFNCSASSLAEPMDEVHLPSVDILVAARDEEAVLERLVARLSKLKYPEGKLSFWIIDDGSKDRTPELLKELSVRYSKLNVINRSRSAGGGKSGALNYALNQVQGEWLFILDADAQLQDDVLLRLISVIKQGPWSALQLRKAVMNPFKNLLTCFQAMEMAMDTVIQQGRLLNDGVVELRGNGQFLKRSVLDKCGGFNEETVTDDLDLSFRLLTSGDLIGILWDPPVQEEAVESWKALWRQRQRWAEGGLQRFFDYWPSLTSQQLNYSKRLDLTCFFLLQYALPIVSFADLVAALLTTSMPAYWPLSLVAFSVSGIAFSRGCNSQSEGPKLPLIKPFRLLLAIVYLSHWFIVIPWVTIRMAIFPKKLVWAKTIHKG